MTLRSLLFAFGSGLLATGCASPPEDDPVARARAECRDVARRGSGYRGIPARTNTQIEQRVDERWQAFARIYGECMRASGFAEDA